MIRFNSDYTEGCHPAILQRLAETNMEQTAGYGEDEYCAQARELIRKVCGDERVDVHFLVGGTQTNVTVISAALKHYQGVITAKTGHINVHETGALEACGHKCLCIETPDGKLTAEQIAAYTDAHFADESFEHMVQPKMVYISNPTEIGTIYKKAELEAIYQVCKKRGLYLFMDGARLGYGLMCKENDLTLSDITANTDVFYIGGTKVGALFGEAVVIRNEELKKDFRYNIKQRGGMLAKGRLLGIQFLTLFEENRYFDISAHAARLAEKLKDELIKMGVKFYIDSPTNQQFPILPDAVLAELKKKYSFAYQERMDETHSAVRFCTCWATKEENVDMLPYRRRMQIVFQDPYASLDPRMTIGDIVGEGIDIHHLAENEKDRHDKIIALLERVGLNSEHANRYCHEFSGGQRQRVGIARALAVNPEFIVCDEPVSALDVSIQAQVVNMFEDLQQEMGLTYLFIAHDLSVVKHISNRIGVMYLGKMVELADSYELIAHSIHPYTRSLISAIPVADPITARQSKRIVLQGDVPSPLNPPSGCRFRTRCPYADEQCANEVPEFKEVSTGHWAACHHLDRVK